MADPQSGVVRLKFPPVENRMDVEGGRSFYLMASFGMEFVEEISKLRCTFCAKFFGSDRIPCVPYCGHLVCRECAKSDRHILTNGNVMPGYLCPLCSNVWTMAFVHDVETPFFIDNTILIGIYNLLEKAPSFQCVHCSLFHPRLNVVKCVPCQLERKEKLQQVDKPGSSSKETGATSNSSSTKNKITPDDNFYVCVWCAITNSTDFNHQLHALRLVEENDKQSPRDGDKRLSSLDSSHLKMLASLVYCCACATQVTKNLRRTRQSDGSYSFKNPGCVIIECSHVICCEECLFTAVADGLKEMRCNFCNESKNIQQERQVPHLNDLLNAMELENVFECSSCHKSHPMSNTKSQPGSSNTMCVWCELESFSEMQEMLAILQLQEK